MKKTKLPLNPLAAAAIPIAVSALSGADLFIRGTGNIVELAQEIPSLTLEASRAINSTLTALFVVLWVTFRLLLTRRIR